MRTPIKRSVIDKAIYALIILLCLFFLWSSKINTPRQQQADIANYFTQEVTQDNSHGFNMKLHPIGVLLVPKINLELLIYDNSSEEAITHGAGLIQGSGQLKHEQTNSILTAHNGDPLNDLFINVPTLKAGDNFYIKHKDKTIDKYTVFDTKTVSPIDELKQYIIPTENETFVTLRTCVPIGINSQRFLATGNFQGNVKTVEESKQALSLVDYAIALVIFVNVGLIIWSFESDRKRGER